MLLLLVMKLCSWIKIDMLRVCVKLKGDYRLTKISWRKYVNADTFR